MRVLVVISVVSFLALVWASISIARHVQKARRQTRALAGNRGGDLAR